MSWHYEITQDYAGFWIREVYDLSGELLWSDEPMQPYGDSPEELILDLKMMLKDAQKHPVRDIRENEYETESSD
jgi:hypothetical protein